MSSVPTEDPAQQLRVPIQAIVHEDSMWTFPTVVPRWRDFTSGPSAVTTLPGEHFTAVEQPQQLLDALARLAASR